MSADKETDFREIYSSANPPLPRRTAAQIIADAHKRGVSQAKKAFAGVTILTARPEGMSYEDYRRYRKEQDRALKQLKRK